MHENVEPLVVGVMDEGVSDFPNQIDVAIAHLNDASSNLIVAGMAMELSALMRWSS